MIIKEKAAFKEDSPCKGCQKMDVKHKGRGLCMRCYYVEYQAKYKARKLAKVAV